MTATTKVTPANRFLACVPGATAATNLADDEFAAAVAAVLAILELGNR